ncbi:MAG: IS3 family transposase [Phascolarctobacterium sp.]|nr:IS3 family transposase [Phascolarctobacterium sp.]
MVDRLPKSKIAYYKKRNRIIDYEIIKQLHEENNGWHISFMCKCLCISRAAYYKWLNKKESAKEKEDARILAQIKAIADSNNSLFGAMNMFFALRNTYHFTCGHNRVYRLMCINNIRSSFRRHSSYVYNKSTPETTAENILKRDFNATKPNEKWCTDVTEIKVPATGEKLYISPVLDLYDRYPVGFSVGYRNDVDLTNSALENAHNNYPNATPLYHSDRGFQYTRKTFQAKLKGYGMTQSMSRISRCIDNGPCESFQGLFKDILFVLYPNIKTKEEMLEAIYGTLDYYVNLYPQKRFKGKTCGQVRAEALNNPTPIVYPIKKANRYIKYMKNIEEKRQRALNQIV